MSNQDTSQEFPIPIRMSGAGYCPRKQAYRSLGYEESDPPDRRALNVMALGDAAEDILIRNMIEDGWQVLYTRAVDDSQQLSIGNVDPPMTGHPDGICRHPIHTDNRWITLECKSMSPERLEQVEINGLFVIYPEYVAQACFYARILFNLEIVSEPRAAIFATMDREGRNPAPDWVQWSPDFEKSIRAAISQNWAAIQRGEVPPAPYQPDDDPCKICNYFTLCHDLPPEKRWSPDSTDITEPRLLAAAEQWLQANEARKAARAIIAEAVPYREAAPAAVIGNAKASWFIPDAPVKFDMDRLRQMLTEDQIRWARRSGKTEPALWIRPLSR